MAFSLNRMQIFGTLGKDPEIRSFNNGGRVCNLSIATSESWKDKNTGERREQTEWHRVAIFTEWMINLAEKELRKGSKVYVEGPLKTRKWQDNQGNDRYQTELVIQGYGGQLIIGGAKAGGGARDEGFGGGQTDRNDWNRGGSGRTHSDDNFNGGGGRSNSFSGGGDQWGDLDDDVPF